MEELDLMRAEPSRPELPWERINDSSSDYVVCYLRFLVSGYLKRNAEEYQHFMENDLTVHEYCMKEVEPMATECEQLHIIALTQQVGDLMQASVQIEYLDNSSGEQTNQLTFPDQYAPFLHLLYRPGHYDILQPRTDKS